MSYLHALLSCFYGGDIARNAPTNDDQIMFRYGRLESSKYWLSIILTGFGGIASISAGVQAESGWLKCT